MSLTDNKTAFETVVERWQEARVLGGLHLFTVDPSKEDFEVKTTAAPSVSDFVADVEIAVRRALPEPLQRYFRVFYSDPTGFDVPDISDSLKAQDAEMRELLGARFIEVGLYPLTKYIYGI